MRTTDAITVARAWVDEVGVRTPGFVGAHLRGGVLEEPLGNPFPSWRDVDICVVSREPNIVERENANFFFHDVLLECGFSCLDQYEPPHVALSSEVSSQLRGDAILADPFGLLSSLQEDVRREYANRRWVAARSARQKRIAAACLEVGSRGEMIGAVRALKHIAGVVAVSRLSTPTNRRCLARMRQLLLDLDELELYEDTLKAFGADRLTRADVESYLGAAAMAYDRALDANRLPSWLHLRLHPHVRPYFSEGARQLIGEGHHREAMYWVWEFHTTAQIALEFDPPPEDDRAYLWSAYDRLLIALGLATPAAVRAHVERTAALAGRVFALADRLTEGYSD